MPICSLARAQGHIKLKTKIKSRFDFDQLKQTKGGFHVLLMVQNK